MEELDTSIQLKKIISEMPVKADEVTWQTFLSACVWHKDIERAKHVAKLLEPYGKSSSFVSLANAYATIGQFKEKEKTMELKKKKRFEENTRHELD